jgi:hypothetical protein
VAVHPTGSMAWPGLARARPAGTMALPGQAVARSVAVVWGQGTGGRGHGAARLGRGAAGWGRGAADRGLGAARLGRAAAGWGRGTARPGHMEQLVGARHCESMTKSDCLSWMQCGL